ncbi:phosphotransferase [Ekhidna sp.]|uniref:phosphotransferase n=1 Tax=Ekhidna sp. TaxID=2608089 RepID=UPI0032982FBB
MIELPDEILEKTGATAIIRSEQIQKLWSGYGEIKRYFLAGGKYPSVIVKHIQWPESIDHPKGWNTKNSHQRKLTSYQVEKSWYVQFASQTNVQCRVPECVHSLESENQIFLIMEDLDASGYRFRANPYTVTLLQAKSALSWLAHFHAKFLGNTINELWPIGTYWHLDTRPDEFEKMQNARLKLAAKGIDAKLNNATHQTLVHGDAKLANFCFNEMGEVAAVDFQYAGKGCGIKDVAYFISSCFDDSDCERYEEELLNHYFKQLEQTLDEFTDIQVVIEEWRLLYKYAWADFYRFLDGWNPGHWKMHKYSERLTNEVLEEMSQINL